MIKNWLDGGGIYSISTAGALELLSDPLGKDLTQYAAIVDIQIYLSFGLPYWLSYFKLIWFICLTFHIP